MPAVAGNWSCTVKTNTGVPLRVRNVPSEAGAIIARIDNGVTVQASQEDNGWYFIDQYGGWSSGNFMQITGGPNAVTSVEIDPEVQKEEKKSKKKKKKTESIEEAIRKYAISTDGNMSSKNLLTKSLSGIYGLPYQFMSSVDRKLYGTDIGEVYADKIVTRMPLLLMTPGKVNFMRDYKNKQSAASAILKVFDSVAPVDLDQMVDNVGRYYTFDFDYVNYYGCVTQMIASGALFLGLDKVKINVTGRWQRIGDINWIEAGNDSFKGILSEKEYIPFYIDSTTQVSESFSNQTTQSQLSSQVNQVSDVAREIQFLLGNTGMMPKWMKNEDALANAMSKVDDIAEKYLSGNKLLSDIGKQFGTVALGGKLLFPEIWQDSTFTKSYNISIKLRTPDGDKLSWFMNIYVPLCHLICMAAPVQAEAGVSGYVSPFLVRAYYRGLFNCEMGIITDMTVNKGKEGAWTIDGLPTEVDVDINLKDLYSALTITKNDNTAAFCNNLCLVDYIANTCGININEPDLFRQLDLYIMLKLNKYKNLIPNVWYKTQEELANRVMTASKKANTFLSWFDWF